MKKTILIIAFLLVALLTGATYYDNAHAISGMDRQPSQEEILAANVANEIFIIYRDLIYDNVDIYNKDEESGIVVIYYTYFEQRIKDGVIVEYDIDVDFDRDRYIILSFLVVGENARPALVRIDKNVLPQLRNKKDKDGVPRVPEGEKVYAGVTEYE